MINYLYICLMIINIGDNSIYIHILTSFFITWLMLCYINKIGAVISIVMLIGIFKEYILDVMLKGSNFDWADIIGNTIGIILIVLIFKIKELWEERKIT